MAHSTQRTRTSDDRAVSAVIGTILMIAATVILGGAIYAATNGFGQKDTTPTEDLVFKATALDTDGDQISDAIKITYLTGPDLSGESLDVSIKMGDGTSLATYYTGDNTGAAGVLDRGADWKPGEFVVVRKSDGAAAPAPVALDGTYLVSIAFNSNTVLDTTLRVG